MNGTDNEFDDSLDNLFDRSHLPKQAGELPSIKDKIKTAEERIERKAQAASQDVHWDRCKKCGGSGQFRGFGKCFACNGKGGKEFKTDAATRAHQRDLREQRKERAEVEAHETYQTNNPDAYAWMLKEAPRFEFAQAMLDALTRWGSLTEKQQAAVDRCVSKQRRVIAERAERRANAPAVDASPILAAFAHARENVITNAPVEGDEGMIITRNPRLILAAGDPPRAFTFSPAKKDASIIYVREGEQYLGKITAGHFVRVRECDEATEALVIQCTAEPAMAAKAYGLHYQHCGVCGRTLTNQESRERGIGPYCAARYGF
jgi:hypothetical protein